MNLPPEDEQGNFIFPDTEQCFKHYNYQTSIRCPVCSRRGGCYAATCIRLKEERDREEVPQPIKQCCGSNDDEFPPYPEGDPE